MMDDPRSPAIDFVRGLGIYNNTFVVDRDFAGRANAILNSNLRASHKVEAMILLMSRVSFVNHVQER